MCYDRTRVLTSERQQSKQEREKRSVLYYVKQSVANKTGPKHSSPNQAQYRSQPQSQIRDTPGVRLKGTRVGAQLVLPKGD